MDHYLAYAINPELFDLAKDIQRVMVEKGCIKSEIITKNEHIDGREGNPWRVEVIGIFDEVSLKEGCSLDMARDAIKGLIQSQYHRVEGKSEMVCSMGRIIL